MPTLTLVDIESRLRATERSSLSKLWTEADQVRRSTVGNAVHLRGLIELSNHCRRDCHYCGLRRGRKSLTRYRMTLDEIMESAQKALQYSFGTVVLQAGEDTGLKVDWISDLIRRIKDETGLAITLSLGEQPLSNFRAWKKAGADRYLLRIETTNAQLLMHIHPGKPYGTRMQNLERLADLGYEVGSGIMVGIPGQTYAMLAKDILWFRKMDLDMIGIGPYLPHPDTPLAKVCVVSRVPDQVPRDELTVEKALALTRLVCPEANLPATTALATLNRSKGRENALNRGANVVMPNLTPIRYRRLYEIYPNKERIDETGDECYQNLIRRITSLGRKIGKGPGSRTLNRRIVPYP